MRDLYVYMRDNLIKSCSNGDIMMFDYYNSFLDVDLTQYFCYPIINIEIDMLEHLLKLSTKSDEIRIVDIRIAFTGGLKSCDSYNLFIALKNINKIKTPYLWEYKGFLVYKYIRIFWERYEINLISDSLNLLHNKYRKGIISELESIALLSESNGDVSDRNKMTILNRHLSIDKLLK